jgi:hypothetical protein
MSQLPPPNDPLSYASAGIRIPSPRPTSVTVIAVLAIVFGSIGVLGELCNIPQYMGVKFMPNPVMDAMHEDSLLIGIMVGTLFVSLLTSVMLLWGGIGALSLKASARKVLVAYAILAIATTIIGLALTFTVTGSRSQAAFQKGIKSMPPAQAATIQKMNVITYYGNIGASIIYLVWPLLVLYFMNRPHVKSAFEQGMPLGV